MSCVWLLVLISWSTENPWFAEHTGVAVALQETSEQI